MATEPLPASLSAYNPNQKEKEAFDWLFNKADSAQLGVLTGDLAVPFFSHSSLPPLVLGEVWQLADPENSGFLTPERFGVACRLIGWAQKEGGRGGVKEEWVGQAGPLPTFSHLQLPAHLSFPAPSSSSIASPPTSPAPTLRPQQTGQPAKADLTSISAEDKQKYARVFAGANEGKVTGLVDGDKARDIFIKSNLDFSVLGQIWNLADTHSRGALDLTDFTIGLHLVHLLLDGSITPAQLPTVLDPKLYAAAAGLPPPGSAPPAGASPAPAARQSSMNVAPPVPAPVPQQQGGEWAITPAALAESSAWFDGLDIKKKGRLEGEAAVGFFGQSGLKVEELAKVWDLADLRKEGYLTKPTFAVAMHLLKQKVAQPNVPLPETLPAELVPPEYRQQQQGPPVMAGPQRDLLDLMDDDAASTPTSVPTLQPQPTGPLSPQATGSRFAPQTLSPQATGSSFSAPPPGAPVVPAGTARAISPQPTGGVGSSFQGLQGTIFPQATGGSSSGFGNNFTPSASPAPPLPTQQQQPRSALATSSTFFDDNDDADLASHSAALSTQASTLRTEAGQVEHQAQGARKSREELEKVVAELNGEIEQLQARISAARATHAEEVGRVEELRARERTGKENLSKARQLLIAAESDLSGLRMEKTELEGEVLRDKEEVRELERRAKHVEEEKKVLQGEVERVRKEVRHGKGRMAVGRKMLASQEGMREGLEKELADLQSGKGIEEDDVVPAQEETQQAAAAAVPLPATPAGGLSTVTSPTASIRSTNPFDRLTSPSAALSPTSGGGTNPFALPSFNPSPAPSPAPVPAQPAWPSLPAQQEQPRKELQQEKKSEEEEYHPTSGTPSIPVAAAAAVGTGALAALGAGAAAVTHAFGGGGEEEKQQQEEETDPFGVPVEKQENVTASRGFDDGFGDDFAASSSAAAAAPKEDFDAAFESSFAPSSSAPATVPGEEKPVEGTLGDVDAQAGFDDAFRDLTQKDEEDSRVGKNAVEGTLGEVEKDAGFEEAFREVQEHHHVPNAEDKGKGKEVEEEESSSDEDDEGPEDVFASAPNASRRNTRSRSPSPSSTTEKADEPVLPSQGAPVEVLPPHSDKQEDPATAPLAPHPSVEPPSSSPTAIEETEPVKSREPTSTTTTTTTDTSAFTSASVSSDDAHSGSGGEDSFVHVDNDTATGGFDPVVGPTGTAESKDMLEEPAPASFGPATPGEPVEPVEDKVEEKVEEKGKRRAAPPPPSRSTVAPVSVPVSAEQGGFSAAVPEPFSSSTSSSFPAVDETATTTKPEDNFDSAFADMGAPPTSAGAKDTFGDDQAATALVGFDENDDDAFDFKPDFGAPATATGSTGGAADGFDDAAFAEFDSSFAPPAASGQAATGGAEAAFGDAFSSFSPPPAPSSSAATAVEPVQAGAGQPHPGLPLNLGAPINTSSLPATSVPLSDAPVSPVKDRQSSPLPPTPPSAHQQEFDAAAAAEEAARGEEGMGSVEQIMLMGFSKRQATEALQKYDYDLNRAVNSLV
ncbi:hypothetical protein JCM8547_000097 [Rhodosporidiobolus lusitaniae]